MTVRTGSAPAEPAFVSHQVTEATRFYLNLNPSPRARLAVVCGGVELVRGDYVVSRRDFPYYCVELVTEGEGTLLLAGRRHRLAPGVVFAYGPGVRHTIRTHPDCRLRKHYLDFAGSEARALLNAAGLGRWRPLRVTDLHELAAAFEALHREARGDDPLTRDICATQVRLLLLKIRQRTLAGGVRVPPAFQSFERVRRHAKEHFLRLRTVEDLARETHVTPVHISRLFRRFGRTGAYQFLLRLKMHHAAGMLQNECLLVKEAAARLGFADAFQFSRAFKRVHGVPPARLLAAAPAGDGGAATSPRRAVRASPR